VIVSADRIGTTHSSTAGGYRALRDGAATTGTIAMPGAWARHAAELYRGEDLGVHLTLNSELDCFRWGPITNAPSLLDGDGGFPRTVHDLWDHADLDEVRRECRAQVERAVLWGFDVTHLTTHLSALQQRPEFFDVLLDLAVSFDLPVRLEGGDAEAKAGFPFRSLATDEGIVFPDHFRLVRGDARRHVGQAPHLNPRASAQRGEGCPELGRPQKWAPAVEQQDLVPFELHPARHVGRLHGQAALPGPHEIRIRPGQHHVGLRVAPGHHSHAAIRHHDMKASCAGRRAAHDDLSHAVG